MMHKFDINEEKDIFLAIKNWIHLNLRSIRDYNELLSWTFNLTIGDKSLVLKSVSHTTIIPIDCMTETKASFFLKEVNETIKNQVIEFAEKHRWIE